MQLVNAGAGGHSFFMEPFLRRNLRSSASITAVSPTDGKQLTWYREM